MTQSPYRAPPDPPAESALEAANRQYQPRRVWEGPLYPGVPAQKDTHRVRVVTVWRQQGNGYDAKVVSLQSVEILTGLDALEEVSWRPLPLDNASMMAQVIAAMAAGMAEPFAGR